MSVSKRLRFEVLRRDNHTCRYCGVAAPDVKLTVDHVIPVALGGLDDPSNLVAACGPCNSGKTSSSPDAPIVADVEQDALRWSKAMDRAAEAQQLTDAKAGDFAITVMHDWDTTFEPDLDFDDERTWTYKNNPDKPYGFAVIVDGDETRAKVFETADEAWACWDRLHDAAIPPKDDDWRSACVAWFNAGLRTRDAQAMMMVTERARHVAHHQRWRYFCGCMWRRLTERQEMAKEILTAEEPF